jgi:hypothetical protein
MKEKLLGILLKTFLVLGALLLGGALWYYTLGRKPKLVVSTKISMKTGAPTSHRISADEVLLLVGTKATLYDLAAGKQKWSADPGPVHAAALISAPTPSARTVAIATPTPGSTKTVLTLDDLPQPILQARVDRRRAKLDKWAAELKARRDKLDTSLKVEGLKEEEAKYQAELVEARAELAALQKSTGATPVTLHEDSSVVVEPRDDDSFQRQPREVFSDGSTIWLVQGRTVRMLDRANGRLTKEISLAGPFKKALHGAGCLYVVSGESGGQRVTRIAASDGAIQTIDVTGAVAEQRYEWSASGQPANPIVQPQRTDFSATGAELLQLDVQLVEKKITERQALKRDSVSDWEAADKNTKGGWSADAAVIAQTMANDTQREMTGGKDLIDESTYEVVLRRPFQADITESSPVTVRGRPEVFSTASIDLVVAGQTMLAFDHTNKKLWEAKLAFPAAIPSYRDELEIGTAATAFHPCLEDDKRLYFFDKGFLNAFDRKTGATLWRLPSVGIRKVQLDPGGMFDSGAALYVSSDNGTAETLQYSQQAAAPTLPLVFKIDAGSGKILWKQEKYEDCFVSGGNVYVTREPRNAEDMINSAFDRKAPPTRFRLFKLSARDGQVQWEWFQMRRPLRIEADKKKVSLLFAEELQILSSIAL